MPTPSEPAAESPAAIEAELDKMLGSESPAVAALVRRLRTVVRDAHPDLREKVNHMWHGLAFHHPRGGYVCALFPRKGGVNVGFEHGGDLHDPHGRLIGKGRTRDVRIEVDAGQDEHEIVVDYLDLAVDMALDRAAHRAAKQRSR